MINNRIKIIAEIGQNHNGNINLAKKLIDIAAFAGFDYVKFQKRNPEKCVPEQQKNKIKETPWGNIKYIDYRNKLEFGKKEYQIIDEYCKQKNIKWFASVWDDDSAAFMRNFGDMVKIPSALMNNLELIKHCRSKYDKLLISTGMSEEMEIRKAVEAGNPDVVFHTNSCYPSRVDELNLLYINWMKDRYNCEIGYSGHEFGIVTTLAAVAMGATWIERHITLDRTMWGSDHLSSVEPSGMIKLVRGIRDIERAMGNYGNRILHESEKKKRDELRK